VYSVALKIEFINMHPDISHSENNVSSVKFSVMDIVVLAAEAEKTEDISASSMEQRTATAAESAATEAGDLSITVEKKLTSEVTETVTVTGMI